MKLLFKFVCTIFLILPSYISAQEYPDSISSYINDFANLIDPETEVRITRTLEELRTEKGIEMTVVTIGSVRDYESPKSVPDFTAGLFNAWGVGDPVRNDGIVFLTAVNDRELFIALGSGYPPAYDDRMDRVFIHHVKPYFVKEDYAKGIEVGVLETIKRTSNNYIEDIPKSGFWDRILSNLFKFLFWITFVFVALRIAWGIFAKKFSDRLYGFRRCPNCNRRMLTRKRERTLEPTYEASGIENVKVTCGNCDYRNETSNAISQRSKNTGRTGGGGFGGGGTSGGGGGGRW